MRKLLLCPPDYYGIEYDINPWMSRERGADTALVQKQWSGLHDKLVSLGADVHLVPPRPKLPDMVFTANAGLTVGKKFIPSNFRHQERAGEAPFFAEWMEQRGYEVIWLPADQFFEGERWEQGSLAGGSPFPGESQDTKCFAPPWLGQFPRDRGADLVEDFRAVRELRLERPEAAFGLGGNVPLGQDQEGVTNRCQAPAEPVFLGSHLLQKLHISPCRAVAPALWIQIGQGREG